MTAAIARWDAFLAQIQTRHHEVILEAEVSVRWLIGEIAAGGDVALISNQLSAVASRLQDLETKIIDTWHARVEQAIFDDGHGVAERDREYAKGLALQRALDDRREELEPRLFAELARHRFAHALAASQALTCSACGAQRAAPVTFRAVELACTCGHRTGFEPGELMRSVAAVGSHALAQHAAIVQWRAMRATERRLADLRPPRPLEPVVEYERSQIAYWRAYLTGRAQFEPELARDLALEIRSRMEQWYTSSAEFEPAWVAAGRPRSPV